MYGSKDEYWEKETESRVQATPDQWKVLLLWEQSFCFGKVLVERGILMHIQEDHINDQVSCDLTELAAKEVKERLRAKLQRLEKSTDASNVSRNNCVTHSSASTIHSLHESDLSLFLT